MEHLLSVEIKKEDWNKKSFVWENKPFFSVQYASIFGIPLTKNLQSRRTVSYLKEKNLLPGKPLILTVEESMFGGKLLFELTRDEQATEKLSGKFFSMVFKGYKRQVPSWKKVISQICSSKGNTVEEIIPYYANNNGRNSQVVLLARKNS